MIRTPLRPLARILDAREKGDNPDNIERENIRIRHEEMRDRAQRQAGGRLIGLGLCFLVGFTAIGLRMGMLAASEPAEPRTHASGTDIIAQRADIVDRQGRILATNMETHSLYAQPPQMIDPERVAQELVRIFPDLDGDRLLADFTGIRKFLWIRKKISPEQKQAVHDIGDPGLLFGPREMRLYPNGQMAAHILGGASFGREGVHAAEVIGVAGVEKRYDNWLRDPGNNGAPLQLSLDLSVQDAMERVLYGGMKIMNAKGAAAVLMEADTGEIVAMASLPDFDPNNRPAPPTEGAQDDSPLFNRAVQGVYELGSTYKIFTAAHAIDLGLVNAHTEVDANAPMKWGRHTIREFRNKNYGPKLSVRDVVIKSSNVGTATMALQIGSKRQRAFYDQLGLLNASPVELPEATRARPLIPSPWGEISTITASYGHGISASPLHLAAGYAAIANGGYQVTPTLIHDATRPRGPRVLQDSSAAAARDMLRAVVTEGTASFGDVAGYHVGGKTGTADKPKPTGGYYDNKVIATFASIFPMHDPEYVLIVTLDEPTMEAMGETRRSAGWTAVPVAAQMITRLAPLLGLRPEIEPGQRAGITLTGN